MAMTIAQLLDRNLDIKIEEVIKLDQTNEQAVFTEITEYVPTERLVDQYRDLLQAMADARSDQTEGVGVWISGFFGSGKSSFAKNLGYVLSDRVILDQRASELFKNQIADNRISQLIEFLNSSVPTEVIMFDVSVDRAVRSSSERIADIMYNVLLRELDYAQDYDIAELEIELEGEGQLGEFISGCSSIHGKEWNIVRKGAQKISRASAILHQMDTNTYPFPDSWAKSLNQKADITVGQFVDRAFELMARRRPNKGLIFIIDEVGQYVARSAEKIEDLRAVVEQFGKESKNRLARGLITAPTWVMVTSQEKLNEVVASIDSRRVELAKLQDRFNQRIDLAPADIREVATKRVLAKTDEAEKQLRELFQAHQGQLNSAVRLERTTRRTEVSEDEFVQFYPYLPHYIEMSIDIMSGIRLQPGAPKHLGGSNRTIIKQVYEMLVSPRTQVANLEIGALVTLDKVFDLVEGNLSSEKQLDISSIRDRFGDKYELKVAKVVALMEFVRDLPRTEQNIAASLVNHLQAQTPLKEVEAALENLETAQFVRSSEDGWKLQTKQEKSWETERQQLLNPKGRERNEITRNALSDIFSEPALKTVRYKNLRSFKVGISLDGVPVGNQEEITIALINSDDEDTFNERLDETRGMSRQNAHGLYWVFAPTSEIDGIVANIYASKQMVTKYDQVRAQSQITAEEAACLADERRNTERYTRRLREKLSGALVNGTGLFNGVASDGASLGKKSADVFRTFVTTAIPDLYENLEIGAKKVDGKEAEKLLKAANLNGLPPVIYGNNEGLNLVIRDGANYVLNEKADIAEHIMNHLRSQHDYGEKDTRTGKYLETKFGGFGYGWERDVLRLVLSALYRAGVIEVSFKGKTYKNYTDQSSHEAYINNTTYRSAVFTPVKPIDRKTLRTAVENYEALTGITVDMERNAIAEQFTQLAKDHLEVAQPLQLKAQQYQLPVLEVIRTYKDTMQGIVDSDDPDDCVKLLADEGKSLVRNLETIKRIEKVLDDDSVNLIVIARRVLHQMWPILKQYGANELEERAQKLDELLVLETYYEQLNEIQSIAEVIDEQYQSRYQNLHQNRAEVYSEALDKVKNRGEWAELGEELRDPLLRNLNSRAIDALDMTPGNVVSNNTRATIAEMESDIAAVDGYLSKALSDLQRLTTPEQAVETVRIANFFTAEAMDSPEAIERSLEQLREHMLSLIDKGIKIIVE